MALFRAFERRALPPSLDPYGVTLRPAIANWSGELVTETTAFAHSAMLGAITLIADSVASMPVDLMREVDGRYESITRPSVLIKPNSRQTMFEFVHQAIATLAVHGNAYILASSRVGDAPTVMTNIHPDHVRRVVYNEDGTTNYETQFGNFTSDEMKAMRWLVFPNQTFGLSPLQAMRNTIGTGIAMDRFLAQFYGEGGTPSSVLETDGTLTEEQARLVRDTWEDSYRQRRRPAVLVGGMKWRPITTSAADMEMLGHREAIVRDIARAYRIPLHLLNGTGGDSQTYQNVESAGINFVRYTLLPYIRRFEMAISEFFPVNQAIRFDTDEFQRADLLTRVRAQQTQIASGTLSPNEARFEEGREPYEGGDQFFVAMSGVSANIADETLGTDANPPK